MNLIYLINLDIPEQEELGEPSEYYYKVSFVKFDDEQDIKSSLIHLDVGGNFYEHYFIVRDKKNVVLKSKCMSFYREKEIGGMENIYKYVKMCEDKTIENEILKLVNPPETYRKDNKIRVYHQFEKRKIPSEYVEYIDTEVSPGAQDEAYLQELDQDSQFYLSGGCYENHVSIKSKCESKDWSMKIEWSEKTIKELYENKNFDRSLYKKFEIPTKRAWE